MPFDNVNSARSFFRESTAALAALVETRPAVEVLRAVYVELSHRARPAALRLREELAARIMAEPAQAYEVVPVIHGEVAPEAREVVISIERGGVATLAPVRAALARIEAAEPVKPRKAERAMGATPRQRRAWSALSVELRDHLRAWDAWHAAWRGWRYFGGAHPGPEPMDNASPEAMARAERAEREAAGAAEREAQEAAHLAHWGGDLAARDAAVRSAPKGDMADAAHVGKVKAHMAAAAEAARAKVAEREAEDRAREARIAAADAKRNASRPAAFRAAPVVKRTAATGSASAKNRARAF